MERLQRFEFGNLAPCFAEVTHMQAGPHRRDGDVLKSVDHNGSAGSA
ncbi:hypothetical protein [Burkholderia pseudomultivorans]|nr:hypothetical protein [Burkholderia pseudomultivorans]